MIKNQLFSYTMDLLDRKDEILKRIYDRCKREGECLIWQQHADSHGYGQICVGNKERLVHRLVLILESGQEGECALHTPIICHNPRCCQIKHLRWGTKKENLDDRKIDGTSVAPSTAFEKGESHPKSKLKDEQVREIYFMRGESKTSIGEKYGVNYKTISLIQAGKTWRHITKQLDDESEDIPIDP